MTYPISTPLGSTAHFDREAVIAFKQGKQLQCLQKDCWEDWNVKDDEVLCFGPWYSASYIKWRVKPDTIEVDVEVKTVVKTKVEIPAPFKGELEENQDYYIVKHSTYQDKWWICDCYNTNTGVGDFDVKTFYVYLDKDTAQKAVDILNGKNGESK